MSLAAIKATMIIADYIAERIQERLTSEELAHLCQASNTLSQRYELSDYKRAPLTSLERYAYMLARMPATLAALSQVFDVLCESMEGFSPRSMLDIGAGPGTASWGALEHFKSLSDIKLLEKDPLWIAMGKELALSHKILNKACWLEHDLERSYNLEPADLVVASYSFQELTQDRQARLARELFTKSLQALIIIEPGTPRGFANIKALREILLEQGAHIVAPCTHHQACPLSGDIEWCHFSARLKRHELHRRIKSATLGYEDEKYSYLVASPHPVTSAYARVIGTPQKRSGHIILDLCSEGEQKRHIIAHSKKDLYRQAKKLKWGSSWPYER